MKIIIVNDEPINLVNGWKPEMMPEKEGVYLATDGVSNLLLSILDTSNKDIYPTILAIPKNSIIKDYQEVKHTTIEKLINKVENNIRETELLSKVIENIQIPQSKETIGGDVLLKAIAVSQNAELIKEIK